MENITKPLYSIANPYTHTEQLLMVISKIRKDLLCALDAPLNDVEMILVDCLKYIETVLPND